jgi:hypothetical protein
MNEISSSAGIVILLVILLVVGINLGLLFMHRNRSFHDQADIVRRAAQTARHPWKKEDEEMKELARRVEGLKKAEGAESRENGIEKDS